MNAIFFRFPTLFKNYSSKFEMFLNLQFKILCIVIFTSNPVVSIGRKHAKNCVFSEYHDSYCDFLSALFLQILKCFKNCNSKSAVLFDIISKSDTSWSFSFETCFSKKLKKSQRFWSFAWSETIQNVIFRMQMFFFLFWDVLRVSIRYLTHCQGIFPCLSRFKIPKLN